MLGKLIKHEFLEDSKLFVPTYIVVLVLSVLGRFLTWLATRSKLEMDAPVSYLRVIRALSSIVNGIFVLAFIAMLIMTIAFLIYRFYKNFFTDQGYLMMTLPVRPAGLVFSKLLNALIWVFFSSGIAVLCLYVTYSHMDQLKDQFEMFMEALSRASANGSNMIRTQIGVEPWVFAIELVLIMLSVAITLIIASYFAIAFGQLLSKNHKVAGGVLMILAMLIVLMILLVFYNRFAFTVLPGWIPHLKTDPGAALQSVLIGYWIANLIVTALLYWGTTSIMKNKLNLD